MIHTRDRPSSGDLHLPGEPIVDHGKPYFAPCYRSRQLLEALAPDEVLEHALTYFRAVRDIRKLIQRGGRNGHPEWAGALKAATDTLDALYVAIRADLLPA